MSNYKALDFYLVVHLMVLQEICPFSILAWRRCLSSCISYKQARYAPLSNMVLTHYLALSFVASLLGVMKLEVFPH